MHTPHFMSAFITGWTRGCSPVWLMRTAAAHIRVFCMDRSGFWTYRACSPGTAFIFAALSCWRGEGTLLQILLHLSAHILLDHPLCSSSPLPLFCFISLDLTLGLAEINTLIFFSKYLILLSLLPLHGRSGRTENPAVVWLPAGPSELGTQAVLSRQ